MINMLMALMEKVNKIKKQMDNVNKDGNSKKEPKWNDMLEINTNTHKECLWWAQ